MLISYEYDKKITRVFSNMYWLVLVLLLGHLLVLLQQNNTCGRQQNCVTFSEDCKYYEPCLYVMVVAKER